MNLQATEIFDALERFIRQRPGLDPRDYGGDASTYRSDARQATNDRARALAALEEARSLEPAKLDVLLDSFRAFSGRLEWEAPHVKTHHNSETGDTRQVEYEGRLTYCTGQYWPTEYRKAAAAVLETYCAAWRSAEARKNPPTFRYSSMADVEAANRAIGGHWFDASTMRFFKTRIESRLIVCGDLDAQGVYQEGTRGRFVTSERGPDGVRRYSVREAREDGSIDTIGAFQAYASRKAAMQRILDTPGEASK